MDLPGLRNAPLDMKTVTESLIRTYLKEDNMFVLVVPASTPTPSTDSVYGLVMEHKKSSSTILVLSRADEVSPIQWESGVVPRLFGRNAELSSDGFKACLATKCRGQRKGVDFYDLNKSDDVEAEWAMERVLALEDAADGPLVAKNLRVSRAAAAAEVKARTRPHPTTHAYAISTPYFPPPSPGGQPSRSDGLLLLQL